MSQALVPNKFSPYNFMQYPYVWNRDEYNNQVAGCIINGRDVNFCQMLQVGDKVAFGFRPAWGDNLYSAILALGVSDSVVANELVDSTASFNTLPGFYFDSTEGALIWNGTDETWAIGLTPVTATSITLSDDIFTASSTPYIINTFKAVTGAWKLTGPNTISRDSDFTTASNGQIYGLMTPGNYYRIKLTVTNWQRGALLVVFGAGGTERLIEGNGTFELFGVCGAIDGNIYFLSTADSNWIGEINLVNIEVNELQQNYTIGFWEDPTDVPVWTDSEGVTLCENGTAYYFSDRAAEDIYNIDESAKCGYFGIVSGECAGIKLYCSDLQLTESNPTYVVVDPDLCEIDFKDAPAESYLEICSNCIIAGESYTIQFAVTGYVDGRVSVVYNGVQIGSSITADGEYSYNFTGVDGESCIYIESGTAQTNLTVQDIVIDYNITSAEFMSECFNIDTSFQCSQQVQFDTRGNYGRCNNNFIESIRVCSRVRNAQVKDITYNWQKNTTGLASMMSANLLDQVEFIVSPIPPYLIKALQIALRSPYMAISDLSTTYVCTGDITPDYNDNTELGRIITTLAPTEQTDTYGIV